jgi:hypothetical protein
VNAGRPMATGAAVVVVATEEARRDGAGRAKQNYIFLIYHDLHYPKLADVLEMTGHYNRFTRKLYLFNPGNAKIIDRDDKTTTKGYPCATTS